MKTESVEVSPACLKGRKRLDDGYIAYSVLLLALIPEAPMETEVEFTHFGAVFLDTMNSWVSFDGIFKS
jgi:hypothetical protein